MSASGKTASAYLTPLCHFTPSSHFSPTRGRAFAAADGGVAGGWVVGFGERDGGVAGGTFGNDATAIPACAVTGRATVLLAGIIDHRIGHWKYR